MRIAVLPALVLALLLAACADDAGKAPASTAGESEPLPAPQERGGSVTGMPDRPGPGGVPIGGTPPPPPPELLPPDAGLLPPLEDNPETGLADAGGETPASGEPTPADAVAVVRDYYAAIDGGDHARAYALWSDGGRSSGQTPEQFAAGFAGTRTVTVDAGEPGRVEGAAGSRFVEVPVSVAATQADGSVRRYVGAYVLRRAVVDGASAGQRAWRIASADLREFQP